MTIHTFDAVHGVDYDTLKGMLGGKGANLNRMTVDLGMPVPYGFTIEASECIEHKGKTSIRKPLWDNIKLAIADLEKRTGREFGSESNPLLVSVRSGAKFSMPGMMETVLNVGLTRKVVPGLAATTNEVFALDSYRRLLQMYGTTVAGIPDEEFKGYQDAINEFTLGGKLNEDLISVLIDSYVGIYKKHEEKLPTQPWKQLDRAIMAVFESWWGDKATTYREIEGIPDDLGTAVNVQIMVFGNMNDNSGTGVAFTRNPNTGDSERYGDFLINAQGEDVVAGTHDTVPLADMSKTFPTQAEELEAIMVRLEGEFKDMCDIEFTIEDGKLWMLQTRVGKRNPKAAIRIAVELAADGILSPEEATDRLYQLKDEAKNAPIVEQAGAFAGKLLGKGLAASPGRVIGKVALTSESAKMMAENGHDVILVRELTEPSDIAGMAKAVGILTAKGGLVSHAAVVARGWGKACVVGFDGLKFSTSSGVPKVGDIKLAEGTKVCIDGETGEVFHVEG